MTGPPCLLVVSPVATHPPSQGSSARIQALGQQLLSRGIAAELLYYGMEGLTAGQEAAMSAFWSRFHFVKSTPLPPPSLGSSWGVDDWCPDELCERVRSLHARNRYAAVLVNYVWMSRVLVDLDGILRIIDTHDLFGDRHLVCKAAGLEPRWFFTTAAEESRGFERADIVIGIQSEEAALIRSRTAAQVITVGHPLGPAFMTGFDPLSPLVTFGYLGSANPWNVRSVVGLDRALGATSDLSWLIAGTILKRELTLVSHPFRLGVVERLETFYEMVDCIVNPVIGGTGLKIKTIEAIGYGLPIIGTVDAFRGLPARHPAHQLETVQDVASMMLEYSQSESLRNELRRASRLLYFEYAAEVAIQYDKLAEFICGPHWPRLPRVA
jgi:Glycosyl transferases group 1